MRVIARRMCAIGAAACTVFGLSILGAAPGSAAVVEASLSVASDDSVDPTSPVDNNNLNGLVPTFGVIGYVWQYSNDATGGDVTFTQTLATTAPGVSFDQSNLAQCTGGGTISPDGHTIACTVLASSLQAGVGFIPITVSVDGTVPNGTAIPSTLTAQTAAFPQVDGGSTLTTVAAAPRVDLRKNLTAAPQQATVDGQLGRVALYTAAVTVPTNPKGTEQVVGDFTFVDDVSGISPNAAILDCVVYGGDGFPLPYGTIGSRPTATATNSAVNSGSIACTQPGGPGTDITVSISGADYSGESFPSTTGEGNPLPITDRFVGVYLISVFVPAADIEAAGGQLNTTNQYRAFDPISITGQSNYGTGFEPGSEPSEPPCGFVSDNFARANDNCYSLTLIARTLGADKQLAELNYQLPGGATGPHAGNGVVTQGHTYRGNVVVSNPGITTELGTGWCDKWDPTTQGLLGFDALINFGGATPGAIDPSGYTAEYAVLNMPTDEERRFTLCDDAAGTWYPSIAAAEAVHGVGTVNASRVIRPAGIAPGDFIIATWLFQALPNPNGTIIGDWGGYRLSYSDLWTASPYIKETNNPAVLGDRVTLSTAVLRVAKSTVPAGVTSILAGQNITYSLQPSVLDPSASDVTPPVTGVTLTDTISSCVQYVGGSASIDPAQVEVTPGAPGADGIPCTGDAGETGQRLVFDLGDVTPNAPIAPVTYSVTTLGTTPNGTNARNTVVISSDTSVPVDLVQRTATYNVLIVNQATFAIAKVTDTPLVEVGDPYRYQLLYSNTTPNTLSSVVLIDELPYVGDTRGTAFSGSTAFTGATNVPAGAVVECTTDAHGSINPDPAVNTNTWSAACPPDTTAVRVTLTNVPTGGRGTLTLGFDPIGNLEGDHYINTIGGGRATGIGPLIPASAPARVDVVASSIGDYVWNDSNSDGIQQAGERPVPGVEVVLTGYSFGPNGTDDGGVGDDVAVNESTATDVNGLYLFSNLHSGAYAVEFTAPDGREFTLLRAGADPAVDSDGESGVATAVTLGVNSDDLTIDAGILALVPVIAVDKTASPLSRPEPGGTFTFTVVVTNPGPTAVTITALTDDIYGNIATQGTCTTAVGTVLAADPDGPGGVPGGSYTCAFDGEFTGNAGDSQTDVVTVAGVDPDGNTATDTDDAVVTLTDVPPTVVVDKTATPAVLDEPGGTFTFDVLVTNTSPEPVTITELIDDIYGDLATQGTCTTAVGIVLAADPDGAGPGVGGTYACAFDGEFTGNAGDAQTDVVTVVVTDDDTSTATATDDATVTIRDVVPAILVDKTATPGSLPEPGGIFTFSVAVTNTGSEPVTITALSDDIYGNLATLAGSTCATLIGTELAVGATSPICSFPGEFTGNAGDTQTDVVAATAVDDDGTTVTDTDDAVVSLTDVSPTVVVDKTVAPGSLPEPGGTFTFTVLVTNTSAEPVTITTLTDDVYGNLATQGTCATAVGTVLPADPDGPGGVSGGTYTCAFDGDFTGNSGDAQTDLVTVVVTDDDDTTATDTDDATVTLTDVPPTVRVDKTATPLTMPEPGGTFTFDVLVTNTSAEPVTITALTDDVYGNLATQGTCTDAIGTVLAADPDGGGPGVGGTYACAFDGDFTGNAGAAQTDVVTVVVTDDDATTATDADDAVVTLTDVPPTVVVDKTATPAVRDEPGGTFTFNVMVTNTSPEPVTITALTDDVYANITTQGSCATAVGTVLVADPDGPGGVSGGTYTCAFDGAFTGNAGDAQTDVVTVVVTDDDGSTATDSDDATVSIRDVVPAISVDKTATPGSLPEPGGIFTFSVAVTNTGNEPVTITALSDDIYGNLATVAGSTCAALIGTELAVGATSPTCTFPGEFTGNAGDAQTDVVTVTAVDDDATTVTDTDDATVTLTDVLPTVVVDKTATPETLPAPGGTFTFTVLVTNTSAEPVTITALTDDIYGNIANQGSCTDAIGTVLAADPDGPGGTSGGTYTCAFDGAFTGNAGDAQTDVVTVVASDDEDNSVTDNDDAIVTITAARPAVAAAQLSLTGSPIGDIAVLGIVLLMAGGLIGSVRRRPRQSRQ